MAQKKVVNKPVKKVNAKSTKAVAKKATPVKAAAKPAVKAEKGAKPAVKAVVKAAKAGPAKAAPVKAGKAVAPKVVGAKVLDTKVAAPEVAVIEKPKQTKKQALAASEPVVETVEDKNIKKAKKALGRAQQSLAKARAKDFGSKLGKNLINQGMDELAKKWESLFKKSDGIDSKPYKMKDSFEERTAIVHKTLGWGFVLSNQNDRLEVLFRDGIRYLISNYKT